MVHQLIAYEPGMPFAWFPEKVVNARREADRYPAKKQLGDAAKRKGNSFYGKMIEDLGRYKRIRFTIGGAYEIKEFKRTEALSMWYCCV